MSKLINKKAVKLALLEEAKRSRPFNKFSRVSGKTLDDCDRAVADWIRSRVRSTPSKGVTL